MRSRALSSEAYQPYIELLRDKNFRNKISKLLDVLDARERKIIILRLGLDGRKPETLEEIGKKVGVNREGIRQMQNKAIRKLKRTGELDGIETGV